MIVTEFVTYDAEHHFCRFKELQVELEINNAM